ncbi:uncharacterized protein PAC_04498 [Phialocephala subalpina]|uniref:2EXR domain-containing protein n=1 Tax=Phialocephala subalpina TaxID=576137 RepID=A0A1L7WPC1_9HELO|nr:uncharacterized protein PAC_04498 [Phialocephala subalpina]
MNNADPLLLQDRGKGRATPNLVKSLWNLVISSPVGESQAAQKIETDNKMAPKDFPQFPRLSLELRDRIWGLALLNDKATEIRIIALTLTKDRAERVSGGRKCGGLAPNNHGYAPGQPALVWVNQEARAVAVAQWEDREHYLSYTYRFINFKTDTFYFAYDEFGGEDSLEIWDGKAFPKAYLNISQEDIGKMRKLVIGFYEDGVKAIKSWIHYFIRNWLQFFASIEEVKIEVYEDKSKVSTSMPLQVPTDTFDDKTLLEKVKNIVWNNQYKWMNTWKEERKNWRDKHAWTKPWPTPLFIIMDTVSDTSCFESDFKY